MDSIGRPKRNLYACLLVALLCLSLGFAGVASAGQFDDTTWNLGGSVTIRIGTAQFQSPPIQATLTLNADRTYVLHSMVSGPDEVGAWFEYHGQILLITQNILDQIEAMESALSSQAGEPVRVVPLRSSGRVSLDSKTGMLVVQGKSQVVAILQNSNLTVKILTTVNFKGTQAP